MGSNAPAKTKPRRPLRRAKLWPRPPGALRGGAFYKACTGCGDCAEICPTSAIELDFTACPVVRHDARCTQCGLCADVCSREAIRLTDLTRRRLAQLVARERSTPD